MAKRAFRAAGRVLKWPLTVLVRPYPWLNARVWDLQYALRIWKYLDKSGERTPLDLIERYAPQARILDLGCGTTVNMALVPGRYRHYHGVDISRWAIRRARALRRPDTSFEVADVLHYRPTETFDVILLREVLYYFPVDELVGLLRRLAGSLAPTGTIIITLYDSNDSLVERIRACGLAVVEEVHGSPPVGITIVLGLPGVTRDVADQPGRVSPSRQPG